MKRSECKGLETHVLTKSSIGNERKMGYTRLMELVSALDEFVMKHFRAGVWMTTAAAITDSGLCRYHNEAVIFRNLYTYNPVRAYFFLIASRYDNLVILRKGESTRVIGRTASQRAKFIYDEIYCRDITGRKRKNRKRL